MIKAIEWSELNGNGDNVCNVVALYDIIIK